MILEYKYLYAYLGCSYIPSYTYWYSTTPESTHPPFRIGSDSFSAKRQVSHHVWCVSRINSDSVTPLVGTIFLRVGVSAYSPLAVPTF